MTSERLKEYQKEYYEKVTKRKRNGEEPGKVEHRYGHGNKKCTNPFYIKVDELSILNGYNNTSLAQEMGVNYNSLSNWMKLKSDIPVTEFFKLCEILKIEPIELFKIFKESKDMSICGEENL